MNVQVENSLTRVFALIDYKAVTVLTAVFLFDLRNFVLHIRN